MGTEWKPTPEEEKLHDLFDQLSDFAESLGMSREIADGLFNTFYNALEEQGKMSVMPEPSQEEIERVRRETARRLGIELDDEPCTEEPPTEEPPTEEPPTPPSIQ